MSELKDSPHQVAVIGMSGRFPKAANLDQFWKNLQDGEEAVSFFSARELQDAGVPPSVFEQPNYVNAKAILDGIDLFDAAFFGFSPREAEVTDPQIRAFLECAWHALEDAGCIPEIFPGLIGVYAGMSISTYLLYLASGQAKSNMLGSLRVLLGNDKDHLATWASYKLNLQGPSINVQTACSTSLVAIHMACQSLLSFECDAALAGGVSIVLPQRNGYLFEPGGIGSSDGHTRSFDRRADGSVAGEGVGVVVLKRLQDAVDDRDRILAVIRGTAVNNDGGRKVGYTAPGVDGQSRVISMALSAAGVEPGTIDYVEAHGSGTRLGDPIEVAALTQAFGGGRIGAGRIALGSVKSNIGHLAAAAGIAGFIKTVSAIHRGLLPPSLHFTEPNPEISFEDGPFFVNDKLSPWPQSSHPRRAGVSSFGLGGTNAHIVLEEAPPSTHSGDTVPWQLLLLSAKTLPALEQSTENLAAHLRISTGQFDDIAFTLQAGRASFAHRRIAVCRDSGDAVRVLEGRFPSRILSGSAPENRRPVVFLLPGIGDHYVDMARGLYETEPHFAKSVDECCDLLQPHLGIDLRAVLYPRERRRAPFDQTSGNGVDLRKIVERARAASESPADHEFPSDIAQPALFVIEYALAQMLISWGIRPAAMLGYSLGEYVAACVSGVLSLPESLRMVAERARLIQSLPPGAMLAVSLSSDELLPLLDSTLSIAGFNGPAMCIVAGPTVPIERLEDRLRNDRQAVFRRLQTSHAYHCSSMEPVASRLTELSSSIRFGTPGIPYISNVSGTWITQEEVANPEYWSAHLCSPVRFVDGVESISSRLDQPVFLEIGPGQMLSSIVDQHLNRSPAKGKVVLQTLPHALEAQPDRAFLLHALGRLWLEGISPDWNKVHEYSQGQRVRLPPYPFERKRYWAEGQPSALSAPDGTDAGAVSLNDIPTALHSSSSAGSEHVAPSSPLEDRIALIWEDLLGLSPVGVHDNFFQMGGNSLTGLRLVAQIREAFGIELSVQKLFLAPTIAELAPLIEVELLSAIEQMDESEVS